MEDMFHADICEKVATWYFNVRIPQLLEKYYLQETVDTVLSAYHAGIWNLYQNNIGPATQDYIRKYKERV